MPAHALGKELLPAISVFWESGIGIFLFQGCSVRACLFVAIVNAGRRGIKQSLDTTISSSQQHMGAHKHAEHAEGLIVFNESHASYIRRKLENHFHTFRCLITCFL